MSPTFRKTNCELLEQQHLLYLLSDALALFSYCQDWERKAAQMGVLRSPKYELYHTRFLLFLLLLLLLSIQSEMVLSNVYKVGDLNAWGIPTSSNRQIYGTWAKFHNLKIGDSLCKFFIEYPFTSPVNDSVFLVVFLYPPSQDSVIQVTEESYNSCILKDPILYMNNGNSLFNFTRPGDFYFISGVEGRCGKSQKIHISVYGNGSYADSPVDTPTASVPSYPTIFGSIPIQASSSPVLEVTRLVSAAAGVVIASLLVV